MDIPLAVPATAPAALFFSSLFVSSRCSRSWSSFFPPIDVNRRETRLVFCFPPGLIFAFFSTGASSRRCFDLSLLGKSEDEEETTFFDSRALALFLVASSLLLLPLNKVPIKGIDAEDEVEVVAVVAFSPGSSTTLFRLEKRLNAEEEEEALSSSSAPPGESFLAALTTTVFRPFVFFFGKLLLLLLLLLPLPPSRRRRRARPPLTPTPRGGVNSARGGGGVVGDADDAKRID